MKSILVETHKKDGNIAGWTEFLRRAYIFANIVTDAAQRTYDSEDIFSKQFENYLRLRNGETKPTKQDTNLIIDALSMMYLGKIADNATNDIPITLSKTAGLAQNVQLVTGSIRTRNMNLVVQDTKDSVFEEENKRYELRLRVDKKTLSNVISLPMLDYFEELRNGVISTNIDPQLSHGVESLKAQLAEECNDDEDEDGPVEMIVLQNNRNIDYRLEIGKDYHVRRV